MITEQDRLGYALAKQVPAMERGFTIATSYGDIEMTGPDAVLIARMTGLVLSDKLTKLLNAERGTVHGR